MKTLSRLGVYMNVFDVSSVPVINVVFDVIVNV